MSKRFLMNKILLLGAFALAVSGGTAMASGALGTLHHGKTIITFTQEGRALVVRQKAGARVDEYQMLLCNVWQPTVTGHQITVSSLNPIDHITTPPASSDSDDNELKTISFAFDAPDSARAAAIVAALKNRPGYCE